jgi:hypothetical protein
VTLVKTSGNIPEYRDAEAGFRASLSSTVPGAEIRTVEVPVDLLKDTPASVRDKMARVSEQIRADRPDVVVALGSLPYRSLLSLAPEIPFLFSTVLFPQAVVGGDAASGVCLDVDPAVVLSRFRSVHPALFKVGLVYDPAISGR